MQRYTIISDLRLYLYFWYSDICWADNQIICFFPLSSTFSISFVAKSKPKLSICPSNFPCKCRTEANAGNIFSLSQLKSVQLSLSCIYIFFTAKLAVKMRFFYRKSHFLLIYFCLLLLVCPFCFIFFRFLLFATIYQTTFFDSYFSVFINKSF